MAHRPGSLPLLRGFRPGLLGDVVALQVRYYAGSWRFGTFFDAKVARELAELAGR